MSPRYDRSIEHLARAERTIPLGSQTFSKSRAALPRGAAPLFVERGEGGRVWDVDGNEYVDLVCGLACVNLGYRDRRVDAAIAEQLGRGITFSLPHRLEAEVAERLVEAIPCAERVRFGKNGSDATSAAIRLARAHTGREAVAMSGYHGWQDWCIGTTTRSAGVPAAVRGLTTTFPHGDLDALEAALRARPTAAVILEAMNVSEPPAGFLEGAQRLAREHGALLVFDETVLGFRLERGGAQERFGVTPDLATFGKGMGNGAPIAAVVGRADVMAGMEEIFFSTTFGGETLSLAAARAVLDAMEDGEVLRRIAATGRDLARRLGAIVERAGAAELIRLSGDPSWTFVHLHAPGGVDPQALRTLFLQEMTARGVLTLGTHNVCAAHTPEDMATVEGAYAEVVPLLVEATERGDVAERLRGDVLRPIFAVR